jgi:hypothetical protein
MSSHSRNVRILLTSGFKGHSWSCAWKEVFLETSTIVRDPAVSKSQDIRQIRGWLRDISQMAGRGWNGRSWMEWMGLHILQRWMWLVQSQSLSFIHNVTGFTTIFEMSRSAGLMAKEISASKLPLDLLLTRY